MELARGLKLVDQVMKVIERVIDKLLRERIDIDEMQFGFVPGLALQMRYSYSDSSRKSIWERERIFT